MPIVAVLNLLIGACLKVECQISQERYDDSKVVAVGLDKVVTCYGRRVDVMLAKVAQKILPHNKNGGEKRKYFSIQLMFKWEGGCQQNVLLFQSGTCPQNRTSRPPNEQFR